MKGAHGTKKAISAKVGSMMVGDPSTSVEAIIEKVAWSPYMRKAYHAIGGSLLVVGLVIVDRFSFVVVAVSYLAAFRVYGKRTSFAVIGVLALLVLTNSRLATLGGTVVWLVGDGLAATVGYGVGRYRRACTAEKTILGTLAFGMSASFAMWIVLQCYGINSGGARSLLVFVPSLVGCAVEALPTRFFAIGRINDNLPVIVGSGLAFQGVSSMLGLDSW